MDAVASRAGVAKTTVYRRFSNRRELLVTVLKSAIGTPGDPPMTNVRDKIRWSLEQIWAQMSNVLGRGGVAALIAASDPEFTGTFRTALAPYNEALATIMEEDRERGLLRDSLDIEVAVNLFAGAYAGRLIHNDSVDEDWLERCMEMLWVAMAGPGADARSVHPGITVADAPREQLDH